MASEHKTASIWRTSAKPAAKYQVSLPSTIASRNSTVVSSVSLMTVEEQSSFETMGIPRSNSPPPMEEDYRDHAPTGLVMTRQVHGSHSLEPMVSSAAIGSNQMPGTEQTSIDYQAGLKTNDHTSVSTDTSFDFISPSLAHETDNFPTPSSVLLGPGDAAVHQSPVDDSISGCVDLDETFYQSFPDAEGADTSQGHELFDEPMPNFQDTLSWLPTVGLDPPLAIEPPPTTISPPRIDLLATLACSHSGEPDHCRSQWEYDPGDLAAQKKAQVNRNRHVQRKHKEPEPLICELCQKRFTRLDNRRTHMMRFHDVPHSTLVGDRSVRQRRLKRVSALPPLAERG